MIAVSLLLLCLLPLKNPAATKHTKAMTTGHFLEKPNPPNADVKDLVLGQIARKVESEKNEPKKEDTPLRGVKLQVVQRKQTE